MTTLFRAVFVLLVFLCFVETSLAGAEDKPTTISDANAAIEANLRTREGKKFDEQMGKEFVEKHSSEVRQCKPAAQGDMRSFWILLKLDKDGGVKEVLLYPSTKLGECARTALLKDKFSAPPRPDYWVGIDLDFAH